MSEVKVYKCNGCGKLIEDGKDSFRIVAIGEEYYVGPGSADYNQPNIKLDFCEHCFRHLKFTLDKIAKQMKTKIKKGIQKNASRSKR